jgi:hypothetical protein
MQTVPPRIFLELLGQPTIGVYSLASSMSSQTPDVLWLEIHHKKKWRQAFIHKIKVIQVPYRCHPLTDKPAGKI